MGETLPFIIDPDNPGLTSEMIRFPGTAGNLKGYLSRPAPGSGLGSVIVIHENKGLNDHIKDVARRLAVEGFAALAPDLLSRLGGTHQYPSEQGAVDAIKTLTQEEVVGDVNAAMIYLQKQDYVNGRIGVVGYCWGGAHALTFATRCDTLGCAIVYYGRNPSPLDQVRNITCPLLGLYGEDDPKIIPEVEPLKIALRKFGKTFDIRIYPGAKHAFNNNTNPDRYHPKAAQDAWERTIVFLKTHLAA
jgi:carboxymethylenebutenolidase